LQHSPLFPAFPVGLALMLVSLAANLIPTFRSQSVQVRTKALIRAAVINAFILAGVIVYVVRHQHA